MKRIFHYLPLLGFGLLCACTHPDPVIPSTEAPAANPYALTAEEALARLEAALPAFGEGTRAPRTVARIEALCPDALETGTRTAATAPGNAAPMGYVANFEGDGYVILSADSRKAPVVAFAEQGSLSAAEFAEAYRRTAADADEVSTPAYIQALIANYLATPVTGDVPETRTGESAVVEEQTAFVRTRWTDAEPYNHYIPYRGPAGAPNIALAQILIYNHKFHGIGATTMNVSIPGVPKTYNPDWSLLDPAALYAQLPTGTLNAGEAGKFVAAVGIANETKFGASQAVTPISKVVTFMTDIWGYDIAQIKPMSTTSLDILKKNLRTMLYTEKMPVYFYGDSFEVIRHAWIADGWLVLSANNQQSTYIHCNFCVGEQYDLWLLFESATPFSVPFPGVSGTTNFNYDVSMIYYRF